MKKLTNMLVGVFCAVLLGTSAFAATTNAPVAVTTATVAPTANAWVMTLGGAGATTTTADSYTTFGINASLGRTMQIVLPAEVGVRQSIGYASGRDAYTVCAGNSCLSYPATDSSVLFTTKVYVDWTLISFFNKKVDVYAGANAGATYGNTEMRWTAAPEIGVDVWLAKNVAIDGRVEYGFDLNPDAKEQNVLGYFLGLKFRF